jgi:hypothetical protein
MIAVPAAIGTVLQIAGLVGEVQPYIDAILRITRKGENISQEELDQIVESLRARHDRIQAADPDRA